LNEIGNSERPFISRAPQRFYQNSNIICGKENYIRK
jgi:hypothetical protein